MAAKTPIRPSPHHAKMGNESLVFTAIQKSGRKLSVREAAQFASELTPDGQRPISERTVRRAIDSLCTRGMIRSFGKHDGAEIYGLIDQSYASAPENEPLLPLNGNMVTVAQFIEAMVSIENRPLEKDQNGKVLSRPLSDKVQRAMVAVVMTSGEASYNDAVSNAAKFLIEVQGRIEFALSAIREFVDSGVWYDQNRDRIGYELRRVQEKNPELYQLAMDFIK